MAAAAGITLTWDDFAALATITPLLCHIYPSGKADVNHFHAAGGTGFVIRELLEDGLLHEDVETVMGTGLAAYASEPKLTADQRVSWVPGAEKSGDESVLRGRQNPFQPTGGLVVLDGVLGRAVMKTSAVAPERHMIEAPAKIFHSQDEVQAAFKAGALNQDFIAVVRFQGPKAIGMPELHKLMPPLGVLQDKGFRVALVTDGRLSGASGKVPSAIHVTPEAAEGGAIALIEEGDIIRLDAAAGTLEVKVPPEIWAARRPATADLDAAHSGVGRELFSAFRNAVSAADCGASIFLGAPA
jgi:phosphogluconate dehydratase